jgi:RNA polymerase sigma-70 factor (ECF subfamily)
MDESPQGARQVGRPRPTNINVIFSLTVLPHEKALLRRGRRLVGNEPDARDLVQETLERALRTFHAFRPGTAVWAWLRTIMNSVWIDGWRRRQAAAKICSLPSIELAAAPEPEPSSAIEGSEEEILARLPAAIERLSPIFREVLELRLQANRSYGEIADQLNIPSRTVGTRILRARRQLRAILEGEMEQLRDPSSAARPPRAARSERSHARAMATRVAARPAFPPDELAPLRAVAPAPVPRAAGLRARV